MILLGIDALLLIFITTCTGLFSIFLLEKWFKTSVSVNMPGMFLLGLMLCTLYFNVVSFWLPVNYKSLIPLFVLSTVFLVSNKKQRQKGSALINENIRMAFSWPNIWFFLPAAAMFFIYWLIPPANIDSGGYHYSTILWYEKYKVIPGLANVHGRFAFNSAAFIIQAAYAFTGLFNQSIYPLNGVLAALFLFWVLKKVITNKKTVTGLIYFLLFMIINRALLINISSPTADVLVFVCILYAILTFFSTIYNRLVNVSTTLVPLLITLFAIVAKLSALPMLFVLVFIFYILAKTERIVPLILKLCIFCAPLYITWLCRNVILSGYLFYPLPYVDIFAFDWKAPKSVLMVDYIKLRQEPKVFSGDYGYLSTLSLRQWVPKLLHWYIKNGFYYNIAIFIAALLSPSAWFFIKRKKYLNYWPIFILWLCIYFSTWLVFINSPDYRFTTIFFIMCFFIPLLYAFKNALKKKYDVLRVLFIIALISISVRYISSALTLNSSYAFSLNEHLWLPLKDKRYFSKNDTAGFRYEILSNGTRLYMEDSAHECINAPLPCMVWPYGQIELRRENIEDGFKNVKDEVSKNYPFVK